MRTALISTALALFILPATAVAGPYGPVIPDSETKRECLEKAPPLPPMPLDGRLLTTVGFGGFAPLDDDETTGGQFAIVGGVGAEVIRIRSRCARRTTGLFGSRKMTVPTIGAIVHGTLIPAEISNSRVSLAVRFALDVWVKGGLFDMLNPGSLLFLDFGGTFGADGPGVAGRVGFASPFFLGMGVQYEHNVELGEGALLVTVDLANLHHLIGIAER